MPAEKYPLNVPVVLASASPRRSFLLKAVGIPFEVRIPKTDESQKRGEKPRELVLRLAREKAEAVMPEALLEFGAALIIAADTIVVSPDGRHVLGKPRDRAEAVRMLGKLQGRVHSVLTGYCAMAVGREMKPEVIRRAVVSKVKIRALARDAIERYVDSGESMDKAGAYAAQGLGMGLIDSITGSYTNVVGLPVSQLVSDLENRFGVRFFGFRNE